jgi:prepilin-type N-terminal cleavage/methylation domain-containing protein
MKMKKQNKKGFSLLELVLVLGVGSMMAFMRFQDMKNEQETVIAKAVGQQMKQMGRRSMVISISAMTSFLR